ncbi:hypothetical protein O181_090851 [Austropuccinia psidii MF-1]|uniref:Uncharacterized protein n=1 Tax=Austropuccinia psidii MF-1 TaxID=1389203 RepID=A0A9Q3P933_9BASI|nr:hypothetical protein [Austropuccinia psidii MF-1]
MNDIEQILYTLPRISTPLNQNEGRGIPNPQVLDAENSQLKNEFSTSFHNLEPSMGQALLKEVPKLKEWAHFSGEEKYDHREFIRGIEMITEDFELPDKLVQNDSTPCLPDQPTDGISNYDMHMDTKVGLGEKSKLSTNRPMILVGLKWKQPLNLPVRCVYETADNISINQQYYDCSYEI